MKIDKDINKLFENVQSDLLTDEVKQGIETLIEAKVIENTNAKVKELDEKFDEFKQSEKAKLDEATVKYMDEHFVDKLDGYLDLFVENYFEKNQLAIDNGIKAELFETLLSGVKNVLKENQINEDEVEPLNKIHDENKKIKDELNESLEREIELKKEIKKSAARAIFEKASDDLTEVQKEKLFEIAGEFDIEDEELLTSKVEVAKKLIVESKDNDDDEDNSSDDDSLNESLDLDDDIDGSVKVNIDDSVSSEEDFAQGSLDKGMSQWL